MEKKINTEGGCMMINKNIRIVAVSQDKQTKIRVPQELFDHLKGAALENGRSFNTEILFRLVKTLHEENVFNFNNKKERNHENI